MATDRPAPDQPEEGAGRPRNGSPHPSAVPAPSAGARQLMPPPPLTPPPLAPSVAPLALPPGSGPGSGLGSVGAEGGAHCAEGRGDGSAARRDEATDTTGEAGPAATTGEAGPAEGAETSETTDAAGVGHPLDGPAPGPPPRAGRRSRRRHRRRAHRSTYVTALLQVPKRLWFDDVSDWCAALTYYAILAVFPPMLVTVSVMSVTGVEVGPSLLNQLNAVVPDAAHGILEQALVDMTDRHSTAWLLVILGSAGSLWFASSYLAVFRRAIHAMNGTKEVRPPWVTAPRILLAAAVLLTLLMSSMLAVLLTGELARAAGHVIGMDAAAVTVWNMLKWPILLCLATVLVLVLFRTGPRDGGGLRRHAPGGALAVLLWLIASGGFALYAAHVGTFSRIYGSLAGIIVFLIWLWLSNLALLTGAQFNAELEKVRSDREG